MVVDEERMMILRMLEAGKITAQEAVELLRALDEGRGEAAERGREPSPGERLAEVARDVARRSEEAAREVARLGEQLAERVARRSEELAERLGARAGHLAEIIERTVEHTLRRIPERLAALEHLVEGLEPTARVQRVIGGRFPDGAEEVEVSLAGFNGSVQVEAWDDPEYRLAVTAHVPAGRRAQAEGQPGLAGLVRIQEGGASLRVEPDPAARAGELRGLSLSLMLPRGRRYRLRVSTDNGAVVVAGVGGSRLEVQTGNGRIAVEGVAVDEARLETANGRISVAGAIRQLTAETANAAIAARPDLDALPGEAVWTLRTSNGAIRCRVPDGDAYGVDVEAATTLGHVQVQIPGEHAQMAGGSQRLRQVAALRTPGFEGKPHRLVLRARTSNGSIAVGPAVGVA